MNFAMKDKELIVHKKCTYFSYARILFLTTFLFITNSLLAEGFVAGTLVATSMGHIPIEYLQEGDLVISYNFMKATIELTPITRIFKKRASEITQLTVRNNVIQVDNKHKFYCPLLKEQWTTACNLKEHHFLLKGLGKIVSIDAVASVPEEKDVYCLSLQDNHNFFISQREILVHNFAIPLLGAAIAWLAENFIVTFGITIFGIGAAIYTSDKSKGEFPQQNDVQAVGSNEGSKEKNNGHRPLTNREARNKAKEWGYSETKEGKFKSHGQPKFKKGNSIITPDKDGHNGGVWKEYDARSNQRLGTWDEHGNRIKG